MNMQEPCQFDYRPMKRIFSLIRLGQAKICDIRLRGEKRRFKQKPGKNCRVIDFADFKANRFIKNTRQKT